MIERERNSEQGRGTAEKTDISASAFRKKGCITSMAELKKWAEDFKTRLGFDIERGHVLTPQLKAEVILLDIVLEKINELEIRIRKRIEWRKKQLESSKLGQQLFSPEYFEAIIGELNEFAGDDKNV